MTETAGRALFIAGTDTEVGKTYVTTRLIETLRSHGVSAAGYKPIECGGREDALAIQRAMGDPEFSLEEINPVSLPQPLAPVSADNAPEIDLHALGRHMADLLLRVDVLLVEGMGGWLAPIDEYRSLADLAGNYYMDVLLVAANRLGALNHCLLTLENLESRGCICRGILLNDMPGAREDDESRERNADALRRIRPLLKVDRTSGIDWVSYAKQITRSF